MHFGKIVKRVAQSKGYSAEELAELLDRTGKEVLNLYEQEEWTSGNIKAVSTALDYNFGRYLDNIRPFNFLDHTQDDESEEYFIAVKCTKGKEQLLKFWLNKMALVAKAIGLEISR